MLTHIRTKGIIIEFMEQTKSWKNLENLLIYGIFEAKTFHTFDRDWDLLHLIRKSRIQDQG